MESLLLLHGAIGAGDQLKPLAEKLSDKYEVHTLDFSGHGGRAIVANYTITGFCEDVIAYMDEKRLTDISVFGYSMGGYVAMYLAKHHPNRIKKIVTLATKFHWDKDTAEKEVKMLDADKIMAKLPAFAETLEKRHSPQDWKAVLGATVAMMLEMGNDNPLKPEDYSHIYTPSLLLLGDRDKMITLEETLAVYRALPNAEMGMLPATHHPIEQANLRLLAEMIRYFI